MRRSNRMKRILREQSGHPYTGSGCNRPRCHATSLKRGATLQPPSKRLEASEQERQEVHDKIDAELHTVGLQRFGETIAQRMELIEVLAARFNNDSRMIRRICLEVLDRITSILEPELQSKLDADSRRDMSIAAYLHDIGKSGPFDAPKATQQAIVKLYAVENVSDPDQTIAETAHTNFSSEDAASILRQLGACGLRSNDTMRAFWDRHGYWTHDILEADSEDIPVGPGLSQGAIIWIGE